MNVIQKHIEGHDHQREIFYSEDMKKNFHISNVGVSPDKMRVIWSSGERQLFSSYYLKLISIRLDLGLNTIN